MSCVQRLSRLQVREGDLDTKAFRIAILDWQVSNRADYFRGWPAQRQLFRAAWVKPLKFGRFFVGHDFVDSALQITIANGDLGLIYGDVRQESTGISIC